MCFEVTLINDSVERVDGADSYAMEGPLTTFYGAEALRQDYGDGPGQGWRLEAGVSVLDRSRVPDRGPERPRPLDSWSVKVASYRTERIARIRRLAS